VLLVARTPPSRALYHRTENRLFVDAVRVLDRRPDVVLVVLARHPEQRRELRELRLQRTAVPERALDARALLYEADAFLGAGGTMTREAALMGIPTFTVFAAKAPAVDELLIGEGKMTRLTGTEPLGALGPRTSEPRSSTELKAEAEALLDRFVEAVEEAGPGSST
jgi:predicted glycosyltransferase